MCCALGSLLDESIAAQQLPLQWHTETIHTLNRQVKLYVIRFCMFVVMDVSGESMKIIQLKRTAWARRLQRDGTLSRSHPLINQTYKINPANALPPLLQVSAEALRVCGAAVSVLRPTPDAAPQPADLVGPLFTTLSERLSAQDQDQEVKEAAIMGMSKLLAVLGDAIGSEVGGEQCVCGGVGGRALFFSIIVVLSYK